MAYLLYGYLIESDLNLPPCPESQAEENSDIVFASSQTSLKLTSAKAHLFHTQYYENGQIYSQFFRLPDGFLVHLSNFGDFFINAKGTLAYYDFKKYLRRTDKVIGLVHHLLPLIISLKKQLVLHAATIVSASGAQLVIGAAGAGKSTFAHYMSKLGHGIYSDDAVRLQRIGSDFHVLPSTPLIRVWGKQDKRIFLSKNQPRGPRKVEGVYLLQTAPLREREWIETIGPMQALEKILPQIFRLELSSPRLNRHEMNSMLALCSSVPMYHVQHAHSTEALKRLRNRLVRDQ